MLDFQFSIYIYILKYYFNRSLRGKKNNKEKIFYLFYILFIFLIFKNSFFFFYVYSI